MSDLYLRPGVTAFEPGQIAVLDKILQLIEDFSRQIEGENIIDGSLDGSELATGAVTQAKIESGSLTAGLTGTVAKFETNDNLIGSLALHHRFVIPAGATGDVNFTLTHKTRILDVWLVKTTAAGGGAGTVQAKNGANAITNAMSIDVADQSIVRATSIDDAQHEVAAGGTLRFTRTRTASTDESCIANVLAVRVA